MNRAIPLLALFAPLTLAGCGDVYTAVCERTDGTETGVIVEWTTLNVPVYGPMYGVEIDGREVLTSGPTAAHVSASPRGFKVAELREPGHPGTHGPEETEHWTGARIDVLELDDAGNGTVWTWDVDVGQAGSSAVQAAREHRYEIPPIPEDARAILRCTLDDE